MAKYVTRTFTTTIIRFKEIVTDGETVSFGEQASLEVEGKVDKERATAYVSKAYPDIGYFIVIDCEEVSELYGMPVEEFMQNATKMKKFGKIEMEDEE